MEKELLVALIGAGGAILAAAIGGTISRSELWDRLFASNRFPRLAGTRWESTWVEKTDSGEIRREEIFEFTSQKRGRVYGYITMDSMPDLKWDVEGDYNDRFLRLFWTPSPASRNKFFLDYGCYFFERRGTGSFFGYAVGFDHESSKIEVAEHQMRQLPN